MSQDYIFNFSHGLAQRSSSGQDPIQRVGLEQQIDDENGNVLPTVFDTGAGMLSEMFNFPSGGSNSASELLLNQINYHQLSQNQNQDQNRNQRQPNPGDWYGSTSQAMQLFITNPSSPSSQTPSSSTLHMLIPNSTLQPNQTFGGASGPGQGHFSPSTLLTWVTPTANNVTSHEGETLSLSLSSTLQHLEAAKVEQLRISDDDSGAGGMVYFNQVAGDAGGDPYRNLHTGQTHQPIHVGFGSSSSLGIVKVLRSSRYVKAVQELLEEFCSGGRGHFKKNKSGTIFNNPNQNPANSAGGGGGGDGSGGGASSSSKDLSPLSSADRIEHQRRKVKLSSMLDEVDRRYNHYCEQMQTVVNSFDLVMGIGAAVPYTALAQKAMSRHFRCLKDAITVQLKHSCELLGEKDIGSGITKGETPRLKLLEQSLRQQRAFHHMGMMEQEAWRPQRGLPERSINFLRAWLFEHFLHPYPNDADKHLLARQTGLSRNQVSNWFINARVRLWKPMVEDMYQQESKEEEEEEEEGDHSKDDQNDENNDHETTNINYKNGPSSSSSSSAFAQTPTTTSQINDLENDPSILAINTQNCFSENQATNINYANIIAGNIPTPSFPATHESGSTFIRFGGATGDVSLTLGLRHAGNLPEKASFSVTDYGGC